MRLQTIYFPMQNNVIVVPSFPLAKNNFTFGVKNKAGELQQFLQVCVFYLKAIWILEATIAFEFFYKLFNVLHLSSFHVRNQEID